MIHIRKTLALLRLRLDGLEQRLEKLEAIAGEPPEETETQAALSRQLAELWAYDGGRESR